MQVLFFFFLFFSIPVWGQQKSDLKLKQVPYSITLHGKELHDPYHWMEQLDSPDVLRYIKKENKIVSKTMKQLKSTEKELINDNNKRRFSSFPDADITRNPNDTCFYYERTKGKSILYCRKTKDNKEEVLIDSRKDLKGLSNDYMIIHYKICPKDKRIAYLACNDDMWFSDNTVLKIKTIDSNEREEQLTNVYYDFVWIDEQTIVYTQRNSLGNCRVSLKAYKHTLGTSQSTDVLLYDKIQTELDIHIYLSNSKKYLFIGALSNHTSEYYLYDIAANRLKLIQPEEPMHRYFPNHYGNDTVLYIFTNKDAPNNKIVAVNVKNPESFEWEEIISESNLFTETIIKRTTKYTLLYERNDFNRDIAIVKKCNGERNTILFKEPAHNVDFIYIDTVENRIRLKYASYLTPDIFYDYYIDNDSLSVIFETIIMDYKKDDYVVQIHHVPSHDGLAIPIVMMFNKTKVQKGIPAPVETGVYGAYGGATQPRFQNDRFSMLDRGFYDIRIQLRGDGGVNSSWHLGGAGMNKKNSAMDFISILEFLIAEQYTAAGKIYAAGTSAGGITLGMAVNMRPDLFGGAKFFASSLDVLMIMADGMEWREFGNPNIEEEFNYMIDYSPYHNIKKQDYPPLLFIHGYKDTNVPCFSTLKMVAKIKEYRTNSNTILMNINMDADHSFYRGKKKIFHPFVFSLAINNGWL